MYKLIKGIHSGVIKIVITSSNNSYRFYIVVVTEVGFVYCRKLIF